MDSRQSTLQDTYPRPYYLPTIQGLLSKALLSKALLCLQYILSKRQRQDKTYLTFNWSIKGINSQKDISLLSANQRPWGFLIGFEVQLFPKMRELSLAVWNSNANQLSQCGQIVAKLNECYSVEQHIQQCFHETFWKPFSLSFSPVCLCSYILCIEMCLSLTIHYVQL